MGDNEKDLSKNWTINNLRGDHEGKPLQKLWTIYKAFPFLQQAQAMPPDHFHFMVCLSVGIAILPTTFPMEHQMQLKGGD
jgi:hypothetical protein